jgi:hypothetical protein
MSELVDKVKKTASDGTERVQQAVSDTVSDTSGDIQETLKLAGRMELQLDAPVSTDACYARFITQPNGRPSAFQLRSYRSADKETFPSVFLQAQVQAKTPGELIGQVVSARLFVQSEQSGAVFYAPHAAPVELKIVSIKEGMVDAELVGGSLVSTSGGEVNVTGSFQGVISDGRN